ncbi:hypothetical protein HPB52_013977 [Rhipicephalus sanguineus]|uniref:Uncharacterized protein n=1 Tax=Rhipicephalus sanguineus TaxID=34632 RepID=A0A9D4TA75_RHISA|nr:hypothetical protein HPB52_013977 [Rhipicephalus sanguineus]
MVSSMSLQVAAQGAGASDAAARPFLAGSASPASRSGSAAALASLSRLRAATYPAVPERAPGVLTVLTETHQLPHLQSSQRQHPEPGHGGSGKHGDLPVKVLAHELPSTAGPH